MEFLYWVSAFFFVYPYFIYPVLLSVLVRLHARNRNLSELHQDWPPATFIISAYNEEAVIAGKLENTLQLDYPAGKLEVIVISDASSDKTDEIVLRYAQEHSHIRLLRQEQRDGKTAGLNAGVQQANGRVIIFSDANAMYKPDSIYQLVKYFANAHVGFVMGAALYNDSGDSGATESEGLYWRYELFLKNMESQFYSVVGGDGAIYAIRKELYWPLEHDDINDFVNPLQIVAKGYAGIFNPEAICYEDAAEEFEKEFRRKRRIVNRSWRAVTRYLSWFHPLRSAPFLFELFSHKVIRWFNLVFFAVLFISNIVLAFSTVHWFYPLSLFVLTSMVGMAGMGALLNRYGKPIPRLAYLPYYFFLVNWAALLGIWDETKGIRHVTWDHVRDS